MTSDKDPEELHRRAREGSFGLDDPARKKGTPSALKAAAKTLREEEVFRLVVMGYSGQKISEELGISVQRVRPLVGDTDSVGFCELTGGSRVTFATGMAVIEATRRIVDELRARAATIWGVCAITARCPCRSRVSSSRTPPSITRPRRSRASCTPA